MVEHIGRQRRGEKLLKIFDWAKLQDANLVLSFITLGKDGNTELAGSKHSNKFTESLLFCSYVVNKNNYVKFEENNNKTHIGFVGVYLAFLPRMLYTFNLNVKVISHLRIIF